MIWYWTTVSSDIRMVPYWIPKARLSEKSEWDFCPSEWENLTGVTCRSTVSIVLFSDYLTLNNIMALKSGLEVTQGHWRCYHAKLDTVSYSLSIVTVALSCISSEINRDTGRKSQLFHTSLAFDPPPRVEGPRQNTVWCGKARIVWLSGGEKVWC